MQTYALDSERAILGTILSDNKYITKVIGALEEKDFYSTKHKVIYKTIVNLFKKNMPVDVTVLATVLENEIKNKIITYSDLTSLLAFVSFGSLNSHITLVKEKSRLNKLVVACNNVLKDEKLKVDEKIDYMQNSLLEINSSSNKNNVLNMNKLMELTMETINNNFGRDFTGISTGIRKIDNVMNGLQKKDFIVFGARPSIGKTALSLELIKNIKENVLYIQLDMSAAAMGQRLIANLTGIENGKIARAKLNEEEVDKVIKAQLQLMKKENLFLYEVPAITLNEIRLKAKEIQIKHGLDVIVIDHIGKIKPSTKGSRYEQMSVISNGLKSLAKELNVALVGLCQLSRAVEQRNDKIPCLSDLRDTGSIEEDADTIGLLYREGYYKAREEGIDIKDDVLEVNFAKNRNGRTGAIKLKYNLPTQRLFEF
ncbi:MAG: DnaB-like helicase C-terminal domain-containing protein [Clostridium perfringens]|uniref:replicative DNA helicase n=1 Tax=Clostridium perfringens TaxID=1502 RepID=UPI001157D62A|nr:DnaB-like helicase C-terminal domain-containing protein [Clostridium perfringens]MDU7109490.1 DnaB-like helicase C-terminal domain-containing protein [Clostridium perfringens]